MRFNVFLSYLTFLYDLVFFSYLSYLRYLCGCLSDVLNHLFKGWHRTYLTITRDTGEEVTSDRKVARLLVNLKPVIIKLRIDALG